MLLFFPTYSSSCVSGVPLYICNDNIYGFVMVPLEQSDSLQLDFMQLINLKLEVLGMYVCNNSFTIIYELHLVPLVFGLKKLCVFCFNVLDLCF
jgi:hypothetical protein